VQLSWMHLFASCLSLICILERVNRCSNIIYMVNPGLLHINSHGDYTVASVYARCRSADRERTMEYCVCESSKDGIQAFEQCVHSLQEWKEILDPIRLWEKLR
jgi:transcription initiation factor TFIIIB Brf1 subunit/transcription initiation factor TFIIB